jgi:hypothetical protein
MVGGYVAFSSGLGRMNGVDESKGFPFLCYGYDHTLPDRST